MTKTNLYIIAGILLIASIGILSQSNINNNSDVNSADISLQQNEEVNPLVTDSIISDIEGFEISKLVKQDVDQNILDEENELLSQEPQLQPKNLNNFSISTYNDFVELLGDTQINTNLVYYYININDSDFISLAINNYTLDQDSAKPNQSLADLHNQFESGDFDHQKIGSSFTFNNLTAHFEDQTFTINDVILSDFEQSYVIQNPDNVYDYSILTREGANYLHFSPSKDSLIVLDDFIKLIDTTFTF